MTTHFHTCRLCHEHRSDASMVRYGRRHYACHTCYLDSGKPLEELLTVELQSFPWKLVRDRDLVGKLSGILAFREARRATR